MLWLANAEELSEDIINPSGPPQTDGMMENQQATYSLSTDHLRHLFSHKNEQNWTKIKLVLEQ